MGLPGVVINDGWVMLGRHSFFSVRSAHGQDTRVNRGYWNSVGYSVTPSFLTRSRVPAKNYHVTILYCTILTEDLIFHNAPVTVHCEKLEHHKTLVIIK